MDGDADDAADAAAGTDGEVGEAGETNGGADDVDRPPSFDGMMEKKLQVIRPQLIMLVG